MTRRDVFDLVAFFVFHGIVYAFTGLDGFLVVLLLNAGVAFFRKVFFG